MYKQVELHYDPNNYPPETNMIETNILVGREEGDNIPQIFIEEYDPEEWGISQRDIGILSAGNLSDSVYWETWYSVLDYARYEGDNNVTYKLTLDMDLTADPFLDPTHFRDDSSY